MNKEEKEVQKRMNKICPRCKHIVKTGENLTCRMVDCVCDCIAYIESNIDIVNISKEQKKA